MLSASLIKTFLSLSVREEEEEEEEEEERKKKKLILFNDALRIFCLRLYGVGHMIKDHTRGWGLATD